MTTFIVTKITLAIGFHEVVHVISFFCDGISFFTVNPNTHQQIFFLGENSANLLKQKKSVFTHFTPIKSQGQTQEKVKLTVQSDAYTLHQQFFGQICSMRRYKCMANIFQGVTRNIFI